MINVKEELYSLVGLIEHCINEKDVCLCWYTIGHIDSMLSIELITESLADFLKDIVFQHLKYIEVNGRLSSQG